MKPGRYTIAASLTVASRVSAELVDVSVIADGTGQKPRTPDPRAMALYTAFDLIKHARDCFFHAAYVTSDAGLDGFTARIGPLARSLQHELLHDIQAAIKQLENGIAQ